MENEKKLIGYIKKVQNISGAIQEINLKATLKQTQPLTGVINNSIYLIGEIKKSSGSIGPLPPYPGPFEITPLPFEEVVLQTKDKTVNRNIKILEIPYYKTSNESGYTVYIGGN